MSNEEKADELSKIGFNDLSNPYIKAMIMVIKDRCLGMSQWKDEQVKQLLVEKTRFLSSSAAQDSVKRCTIEEIYRELFNEEMPNSNPYIK